MPFYRWFAAVSVIFWVSASLGSALAEDQWNQFRGPNGDGIAQLADGMSIPVEFSESKNVTWKAAVPGRAWSSPVIADGVVWMTTAVERAPDEESRLAMLRESGVAEEKLNQLAIAEKIELKLIAIDLVSGKQLKNLNLVTIEKPDAIHSLNSYASPTPVIDDIYIFCHFGTFGTFCIDRGTSKVVWQRKLPLEHGVGPGSSPMVHGGLLALIQDGMDRQYVTALDVDSGMTVWETKRPEMDTPSGDMKKSYCTPIAITDKSGREQLICMGSQWIVAYEPKTGAEVWRLRHGKGFSVVPRPVFGDGVVYFSTGFGKPELFAVRVDGSGDVTDSHLLWTEASGIPKKPSPILDAGLLYLVSDNGVASCLDATDGSLVWKKRLGGDYSASPILVGSHLYFGSHDGKVTVMNRGRETEVIAVNELDGKIMASPAVVGDALILRTDKAIYRIEG